MDGGLPHWSSRRPRQVCLPSCSRSCAIDPKISDCCRTDARRTRLFGYYTLRGLSLLFLPLTLRSGASSLVIFAVFYGLDWIATVPPTVRLTSEAFGRENTGVVYGWIGASHQLGASAAAFGAGAIRTMLGDYQMAFWSAGVLCVVAGLSFLTIGRTLCPSPIPLATVATS